MRKNSALAALTEDERNQILQWLDTSTFDEVRERVAKPRPEGFNLKISNKPLQNLRAHKVTVDKINRRVKEGKPLTLAEFDAIRAGEQKVLSEEVHDAILAETYDQVLSRENTPGDLLKLQQLADFGARADYRAHKVAMDLRHKELSERRFALSERALNLRERVVELNSSKSSVANQPSTFQEDALGRLARTRADVRRRARAQFGRRSTDIPATDPAAPHETTEEITNPSPSDPTSKLPVEPSPAAKSSDLTESLVATPREKVAATENNEQPATNNEPFLPEPTPSLPNIRRGNEAHDLKKSAVRIPKSEIVDQISVDSCPIRPDESGLVVSPSAAPSVNSVPLVVNKSSDIRVDSCPLVVPIPEKTKAHAIKRWRAHIRRPVGTPEPDTSWRDECPCGNLAPCAEHPELKARVRYYRPQHPDYREGLDANNVAFYKPTAEEIGCTQEELDKSCDHFAYNPRMKDPPDPRFAPDWLKPAPNL